MVTEVDQGLADFAEPFILLVYFNSFKKLASIRNPLAYQAAIHARVQREYLEWSKERDRIERERRIIAENKAWTRNKPCPPGFRKDSSGYLYRLTPEEQASENMSSDRRVVKKTAQQVAMRMRSRTRTAMNTSQARLGMFNLARNIRPIGEAAKIAAITTGMTPMAPSGWSSRPGELKYLDTEWITTGLACDTSGWVGLLNNPAQGTTVTQRVGDEIRCVSLRLTGYLRPSDGSVTSSYNRLMIVWDVSPNAAATVPAVDQILTQSNSLAQTNLTNRKRFIVLRDIRVATGVLDNTLGYASAPNVYAIDEYIKIGSMLTVMNGTGSSPGNMNSGALYLVTIGDQGPTDGASFWGSARLRFTDA